MTLNQSVLAYSAKRSGAFSKDELVKALSADNTVREGSISVALGRLVKSGALVREERGMYSIAANHKKEYLYVPSDYEKELSRGIRKRFPFIEFCVWNASAVAQFMQHVPDIDTILVDVERDADEAVFHYLQSEENGRIVFLNPTREMVDRYMGGHRYIVVRTLISEAPLNDYQDYMAPKIEKMMVDSIGDPVFGFAEGAEIYTIYENILSEYSVSIGCLNRYAARRNRKDDITKILDEIGYDKQRQQEH